MDVHFQRRAHSWGWATWNEKWSKKLFDKKSFNDEIISEDNRMIEFKISCGDDIVKMIHSSLKGEIDSWYVWWVYNHFINNSYAVYPILSKVKNIGFSQDSTHCQGIDVFKIDYDEKNKIDFNFKPIYEDQQLRKQFLNYFKTSYKLIFRIKLLTKKNGIRKVLNELKFRLLNY